MNQTQIDYLRDLAIEFLPRAQADRAQANRFGSTDLYSSLAYTSVMVRSKAGTTAVEYAAANVLGTVALLHNKLDIQITKPQLVALYKRLAADAKELCFLADKSVPWLDAVSTAPEPDDEPPAPPAQKPLPAIAGRFLTTREAAQVMGCAGQTLRMWSSTQSGPISPVRGVGRHLKWSGDEILALMAKK